MNARVALAVAATLFAGSCRSSHDTILYGLSEQLRLRPAMQVEDIYKLAHQAAFGNEHLIASEDEARRYLLSELASVKASDAEPLIEMLSRNASVARMNLRPFKARGHDPERLFEAMLASARAFRPDKAKFERSWQDLIQSAGSGWLPWTADELRAFGAAQKAAGYPAIHHSDLYKSRYQPAYRVLTLTEAVKVMKLPRLALSPGAD